jgi:hypothetical protein
MAGKDEQREDDAIGTIRRHRRNDWDVERTDTLSAERNSPREIPPAGRL